MAEDELSKRIDDVHRRLDDLRADGLQLRQEITQLRHELVQFRQEVHQELNRRFGQLFWQMNIWFALLTLLMTAYRFLR